MAIPRRRFLATLPASGLIALHAKGLFAVPQVATTPTARADLYPPVIKGFPHILHGGDWNPDQWRHEPKILDEDLRLMEKAGGNTFSVGIFAWSTLEPSEEYAATTLDHYRPFWKLGVPVDVIESLTPFEGYRLIVAPMLFMLKPGVAVRLKAFVRGGGTLLLTYLSGIVDENNLVLRGGWPGDGLRELTGLWAEEIDSLYPDAAQKMVPVAGNPLSIMGEHAVRDYTDLVNLEGAKALATYAGDAWAGRAALTVNTFGAGSVYYLAARPAGDGLHDALARALVRDLGIGRCLDVDLPEGVTVQRRSGGGRSFLFLHNFERVEQTVDLGATRLRDALDRRVHTGRLFLPAYASLVLEAIS